MLERRGNKAEALVWYERAAGAGVPDSIHALAQLWHTGFQAKNGRFVRDMHKANALYEDSAAAGYLPSKDNLVQLRREMMALR